MARPRLHDDALRARLLEEASAIVATSGAAGLTVRDLAARAGTSASAVYSLFGSREDLVRAVGDEAFARFAAAARRRPAHRRPRRGPARARSRLPGERAGRTRTSTASCSARRGAGLQDGTRGPATASATFLVLRDAVARVLGATDAVAAEEPAAGAVGRSCTGSSSSSSTGSCRPGRRRRSGTSTLLRAAGRASSTADLPVCGGACHGGGMAVSRTQVLRYRVHAQQLDRATGTDRGPDDAAILDLGVAGHRSGRRAVGARACAACR